MDTDICNGKINIYFRNEGEQETSADLMCDTVTHVTNFEVLSIIEGWIGETVNVLKMIRGRKLRWFGHIWN